MSYVVLWIYMPLVCVIRLICNYGLLFITIFIEKICKSYFVVWALCLIYSSIQWNSFNIIVKDIFCDIVCWKLVRWVLTLYISWVVFRTRKKIHIFVSIISKHWNGICTSIQDKDPCIMHTFMAMTAADLATQGARSSAVMVITKFWNIANSAPW